jgi:hypothetical protein
LPNIHRADLKRGFVPFSPGLDDIGESIVELHEGSGGSITPWLATDTIGEISIGPSDSEVEDEIELLVEGGVVGLTLPRIVKGRAFPLTFLPKGFSDWNFHHALRVVIDVGVDLILVPDQAIGVEVLIEIARGHAVVAVCRFIWI